MQPRGIHDKDYALAHLRRLGPRWTMVTNEIPFALRVKQASPGSDIIFRKTPDGNNHERFPTPDAFFAAYSDVPDAFYLKTINEAGFKPQTIQYDLEIVRAAKAHNRRVAVLSLGTGQPGQGNTEEELIEAWRPAHPLLVELDRNRDRAVMILNQYGAGDILDALGSFPTGAALDQTMLWHVGRHKYLYAYCDRHGIRRPRVVIGEGGWDLGESRQRLLAARGIMLEGGGQHRLVNYWKQRWPGKSFDEAAWMQLKWAADNVYSGKLSVEGWLGFTFGAENLAEWWAWLFDEMRDLHREMEGYAMPEQTTPEPVIQSGLHWLRMPVGWRLRLRAGHSTNETTLGVMDPDTIIDVVGYAFTADQYGVWVQGRAVCAGLDGWFALVDGVRLEGA